ncbi:hypothetical protein GGR58DRAFT_287960 [Xylaria digitata]|nr:hypothetical protein GGR58DRAFT_287960 [Xylaria digitata]
MHLPVEMIDNIVDCSIEPKRVSDISVQGSLPKDGRDDPWDVFISCDYNSHPYCGDEEDDHRTDRGFAYRSLEHVYNLRLVSATWNSSVIRILRQYGWRPVNFNKTNSLEEVLELCKRKPERKPGSIDNPLKDNIFNRLLIPTIGGVRSFTRWYDVNRARVEGRDLLGIYKDTMDERTRHYSQASDMSVGNRLVRDLMNNLTCVEAFSVAFEDAHSHKDEFRGGTYEADCYDVDLLDMAMDTILYGLRSPAFQHLFDLRLRLPGTRDIGRLAAGIPDNVKRQLKHLYLEVVDETGPGGKFYPLPFGDYAGSGNEDPHQDGAQTSIEHSAYAPSNLQAQYPNRDHQNEIWAFIESCNNLESLGLHCTHYLSLDRLNWKPGPKSRGLRALYLNRVYANAQTLINLLTARDCEETRDSVARRVDFTAVRIYRDGGDWSTVFSWLSDACPRLEFLHAKNLTYFSTHEHFCPTCVNDMGDREIWTQNFADEATLRDARYDLAKKAGRLSHYPELDL